jgi:hypothetical protein
MSIRLETSKRSGVLNDQGSEIHWGPLQYLNSLANKRPFVKKRTEPSPVFNCHGLTFASRRTKITATGDINVILKDDRWEEIPVENVLPGDIIIYFDADNDVNHSGIVVGIEEGLKIPLICSKWGIGCEYVHRVGDVPSELYGPGSKYYRCRL